MNFIKHRKIYFIISGILVLGSIASLVVFGLKGGIDFTGGSLLEVEYIKERPSVDEAREALSEFEFKELHVRPVGEKGMVIRVKQRNIPQQTEQKIVNNLKEIGEIKEEAIGFESISPVIGEELKQKTKIVIILSLVVIVLYIAFAFRKISQPLPSWQYGIASLIALTHDVLIPFGIFSLLGKFMGIQITIPVITAFLVILGYSINDTVVIFDRIRENLLTTGELNYANTVNDSLNQTLVRSINTSLTTLFVLVSIFIFGGSTLQYFSLTLIIGILLGTYSSLFLAPPLLVSWLKWRRKEAN